MSSPKDKKMEVEVADKSVEDKENQETENVENKQEQSERKISEEQQEKNESQEAEEKEEEEEKEDQKKSDKVMEEEISEKKTMQEEKPEKKKEGKKSTQKTVAIPKNQAQKLYCYGSAECDQYYIDQEGVDEDDQVSEKKKPYLINYFTDKNILIHKIVCGGMHTVALTTLGDIYTWGCNDDGALGRKTNENEEDDEKYPERMSSKPERVQFPGNYKFNMISAGDSHTCCANSYNNTVYQWGNFRDTKGAMFKPKQLPTRIGEKELKNKDIQKIVSGAHHLFILASQILFAWGDPDTSVLGRKPTERHRAQQVLRIESIQKQVEDVWSGAYHGFLKKTRTKKNSEGQNEKIAHYYSWGLNNFGQLGIDSTETTQVIQSEIQEFRGKNITQIAGGEHHTLAVQDDGQYYVWGKNDDGQLGLGEDIQDFGIYTEEEIKEFTPEEKKDNTVAIRKPFKKQIKQKEDKDDDDEDAFAINIKQVFASGNYSYAFSDNSSYQLYSWGMGDNYVLGSRGESTKYKPWNLFQDKVLMDEQVQQIALSGQHVCYISSDSQAPALDIEVVKNGELPKSESEILKEELKKEKLAQQEKNAQIKAEQAKKAAAKKSAPSAPVKKQKETTKKSAPSAPAKKQTETARGRSKTPKVTEKKEVKKEESKSKSKPKQQEQKKPEQKKSQSKGKSANTTETKKSTSRSKTPAAKQQIVKKIGAKGQAQKKKPAKQTTEAKEVGKSLKNVKSKSKRR